MIDLTDLSSAIQLACGLNLAVGVILQRHSAFISSHQELVDYVRNVGRDRVKEATVLQRLENQLARTENAILTARFADLPLIKRLRALCFVSGTISIFPLILPAFIKPVLLSSDAAIIVLISVFSPIPLALLGVELQARRQRPAIAVEKNELCRAINDALQTKD